MIPVVNSVTYNENVVIVVVRLHVNKEIMDTYIVYMYKN